MFGSTVLFSILISVTFKGLFFIIEQFYYLSVLSSMRCVNSGNKMNILGEEKYFNVLIRLLC